MIWRALRVRPQSRFYLVILLAVVTLGTGMATGFGLFYRLLYVLALTVVVGYGWNWVTLRGLNTVAKGRTRQAQIGECIEEAITITNSSLLPKYALEIQDLTDLPGYSGGIVTGLFGGKTGTWNMKMLARKRGRYQLGPLRVSNLDPFGLFRREREFGSVEPVLVFPRTHELPEFRVSPSELSGDSSARRRAHNVTPQVSSIRDYAPGDSLSRVHWNSSARLGKLMSKEFDLGRAAEVWIVVDLDRNVQAGELEESTDEYGVSIAASLAKRHVESGLPVGLLSEGDKRYFLAAETGVGQYQRIMQLLALSRAEGTTPLELMLANEEPLWTHLSTVIVITSSPRPSWVAALRELTRRGVRVVVVLVDAASFGSAIQTLDVLEDVVETGMPVYVVGKGEDIPSALARSRPARDSAGRVVA